MILKLSGVKIEFMMRFYMGTVGILFNAFLLSLFICEEDRSQMLYQPILP